MGIFRPREAVYKRANATLTVGVDDNGDVYSYIEKAGKIIARDMYIHLPFELQLAQQGWVRVRDS